MSANSPGIGWIGIVRIGLVQTALGAIVVLMTSTLNRVMVVELGFAAVLPGALVALHYFIQISRPRFGHGSDTGRRRTPWIIAGMAVLAGGGVLAALATALMGASPWAGIALAVVAFLMIGAGIGASGTCLLVLLAASVPPANRAAAASITWIMMIAGFVLTAGIAGAFLDPFSFERLIIITMIVAALSMTVTIVAMWGLERGVRPVAQSATSSDATVRETSFRDALQQVAGEPHTRIFALFVFLTMLAYSAQDLVLEPFAGAVFGLTPGESTQLGGMQHGGVLVGMLLVAVIGRLAGEHGSRVLRVLYDCRLCRLRCTARHARARRIRRRALAAGSKRVRARHRERCVRRCGDRDDDDTRLTRREKSRRRAHGHLGSGAGARFRSGRHRRHARRRYHALAQRFHAARLCAGLRFTGCHIRRGRRPGAALG